MESIENMIKLFCTNPTNDNLEQLKKVHYTWPLLLIVAWSTYSVEMKKGDQNKAKTILSVISNYKKSTSDSRIVSLDHFEDGDFANNPTKYYKEMIKKYPRKVDFLFSYFFDRDGTLTKEIVEYFIANGLHIGFDQEYYTSRGLINSSTPLYVACNRRQIKNMTAIFEGSDAVTGTRSNVSYLDSLLIGPDNKFFKEDIPIVEEGVKLLLRHGAEKELGVTNDNLINEYKKESKYLKAEMATWKIDNKWFSLEDNEKYFTSI